MDFSSLLSWTYLTQGNPGGDFLSGYVLLAFFIIVFLLPGIIKNRGKGNKSLRKSAKKRLWVFRFFGVLGIICVASRFGEVPFFGMRLWLLVITLLTLFFLVRNLSRIRRDYRKRVESAEREKMKS